MTITPAVPSPGRYWLDVANDTADPYSMIGAAVTGLLAVVVDKEEADDKAEADTAAYDELLAEFEAVSAGLELRQRVIDDILEKIRKSTAKLSNEIREIVDEAFKVTDVAPPPPAPQTEPVVES